MTQAIHSENMIEQYIHVVIYYLWESSKCMAELGVLGSLEDLEIKRAILLTT